MTCKIGSARSTAQTRPKRPLPDLTDYNRVPTTTYLATRRAPGRQVTGQEGSRPRRLRHDARCQGQERAADDF